LARIARQSIAHCVEARKEAGDACLDDSSHDGSIPRNEHALSVMSGLVPAIRSGNAAGDDDGGSHAASATMPA
jgi:hypothetical protein